MKIIFTDARVIQSFHSYLMGHADVSALWSFEEATSNPGTIDDLKGTNDLTVTTAGDIRINTLGNEANIKTGGLQSMQLADASPYMTPAVQPNAAAFTIGMIFKTGASPAGSTIPLWGNATLTNTRLTWSSTTGFTAAIRIGSTTTVAAGDGLTTLAANTVYVVIVTWDGTTLKTYRNGTLVDSVTPSTGGSANWASGPLTWFRAGGTAIASGYRRTTAGTYDANAPSFDEFFFGSTALSASDISALQALA